MKCSKCGHRARTIAAMARHYRKKHPGSMKVRHHKPKARRMSKMQRHLRSESWQFGEYCPSCGRRL